jgi:hypothetical protein
MFHGPRRKLGRVALAGAVVVSMVGTVLAASLGVASATNGCGTTPADGNVYINCDLPPASTPYTTYTDGEQVDLSMGTNGLFSQSDAYGGSIVALECEYNNGTGGAADPPSANYCDAQTAAGDFPETVNSDGSWDYAAANEGDLVGVYAVPGTTFQGSSIKCDAVHACVLYAGENYNNFTVSHVFSNPFLVDTQSITSAATTSVVVGSNENLQVAVTGPTATFTDTSFPGCTASTLPGNVTFNSAGLLSGVPADGSVGSYNVCAVATSGGAPAAAQNITFTVTKAPLTVTASSASFTQGGTVPTITAGYSPFVNGDTASSLTTAPKCATTATNSSTPGPYPSTCSGAVDPNYTFNYVAGTVTVNPSFYITTTESAFPSATDGVSYSPVQLAATGGTTPYKWKLTGGALPKGLKVHPTGLLSGTPKSGKHADAATTYSFTVTASTHKSKKAPPVQMATATFTITITAT